MDRKLKILVLEDVQMDFELMEHQLEKENISFISKRVETKADFKKELKDFAPDIILSDYSLPQFDGLSALKIAKEQTPDIPFIIVTGSLSEEVAVTTMKAGAWDYVMKDKLIRLGPAVGEALKLKDEIGERKQAEDRIVHLNSVLKAIRNINQLVVVEKDRDRLLRKVCDALIETRGYYAAWIGFSGDEKTFSVVKGSGFKTEVSRFIKHVISGDHPHCIKKALAQKEKILIIDKSGTCGDCFFKDACVGKEAAVIRIEHDGRLLGLLAILLVPSISIDDEERTLLQEVAGDIAFALHDMELEKRREQAEDKVKERVKELQVFYELSEINEREGITLDELFQETVRIITSGWQYPEITCARITIGGKEFATENWNDSDWKQTANIIDQNTIIGKIEVCYLEDKPELDEGPFLNEERLLLNAIAERLGRITERKRAEDALRESEEKYRTIFENVSDQIVYLNKYGTIISANDREEIFGRKQEEIIGKHFTKLGFFDAKDIPRTLKLFKDVITGRRTIKTLEMEVKHKDGHKIPVEVSTNIIKKNGKVEGFLCLVRDITERKQAEKVLRIERDNLKNIFETMEDGIYITDQHFNIQYVNPVLIKDFGNYEGRKCYEYFHDRTEICPWCKNQEVFRGKTVRWEWFSSKNGKTYDLIDTPLKNPDGSISKLKIFRDITERLSAEQAGKQAEEKLRESEQKYRALFEGSPDGIIVANVENGQYIQVNPAVCKKLGYSEKEIKDLSQFKGIHPKEEEERIKDLFFRQAKGEIDIAGDIPFVKKDGTIRYFDVNSVSMEVNGVHCVVGLLRDITERKQAEEALLVRVEELSIISEMSSRLSRCESVDEMCRLIGEKIYEINNKAYIAISLFDRSLNAIRIRNFFGFGKLLDSIIKRFGIDPKKLTYSTEDMTEEESRIFTSGKLEFVSGGLYDLMTKKVPERICKSVENILNIDKINTIGFALEDIPYGGVIIMTKKNSTVSHQFVIETLVNHFSVVINRKQAEGEIRENEEKYHSLIESSADPIYLINRNLEYIYANKILLSRLGKSGAQVFGHNYGEFHSPEGTKLFSERIGGVFKSKEPVFFEYRSARDRRYFLRTLNPVMNPETGAVTAVTVISKDITDLKQSEEKLYMANKRLQHLLFSSTTVIYSCETSADYGITYSSENVLIITGYLSYNFIKDPKFWIDHIHPEDRECVLEKMSTISKTENLEIEYRFRKKEGEYIWLHDTKKLIRDEHGAPVEIVGSLLDVTERKQAIKALGESEKNFRALVENSFDGIFINDKDGNYLYANRRAAEISGYSVDELLKLNVKDLTPSADVEKVMERIKNRIKNRTVPSYFEGVCVQKDGNEIQLEITAAQTTWQGKPAEIISMRDTSERKKLEQQLLQSQKMETVGNLAGGVAHDFNNLLTIILGQAQMMKMNTGEDDPSYRRIGQIISASTRAANLTRQLLLFSRKQLMELLPLNLNNTISNLLKMLPRLIGEDISIRTNLQSDLWIVNADESNIEQVVMNICLNARDAMPGGGYLIIKTENIHLSKKECKIIPESYSGNFVRLMIEDSGTGIPQDVIKQIFEPFFTTKEVGKGTGLGLSVVYGIVKKHDGWINVYSEPDKGTIFKIYLPVTSKAVGEKTGVTVADVAIHGNGERVLLIEDEEDVRGFIASALRQYGYILFEASNASGARSVFKSEKGKFDLIFSDVILPDKNGFDLVEELLSGKKDIPVIMCSGYTEEKVKQSIISKRGFQFIQKPFKMLELLKIISSTVGLKKI